jgi:multicomponent K+:H+ antiporter subunit A
MTSSLLALALALPFAFAPLAALMGWRGRQGAAWAAAGAFAASLAMVALFIPAVLAGEAISFELDWAASAGLRISLMLDGLGLLFALLILGIGLLIVLYAAYYMPDDDRLGRFYALLLVFAGAMLGLVLSQNVLALFVFWEMTSIASFLLIAYKYKAHDARLAARMALAVTGGGGLALFAGLMLLAHVAGSFDLRDILARGDLIRSHALYPVILILVLLGAFSKSAQIPLHFWLPNAMAAPTPVSAYLHSATMVKAGIFLLARLHPSLAGSDLWFWVVTSIGAITFVAGAFFALAKHDFKGLLAYSTISHLGLITLLLGLDTPTAMVAALFHTINHAIFKASLFMAAGVIDRECGTRDMRRINGLFARMPWTGALAMVSAGAMAGVPLLNGFLSKEMFFAEAVAVSTLPAWLLPALATLAGIMSVAYSLRFAHDVFFNGEPIDLPREPKDPPRWLLVPIEVLVVLMLALGLAPNIFVSGVLAAAASAALGAPSPEFKLAIWHGFNLPLVMSAVALLGGMGYYALRHSVFRLQERFKLPVTSPVAFERTYDGARRLASRLLAIADNRAPARYALYFVVLLLALASAGWTWTPGARLAGDLAATPPYAADAAGLMVLAFGAVGAVLFHRHALTSLIFVSLTGLLIALVFVRLGAADLALTQLSVEVVTIVLLLAALRYFPSPAADQSRRPSLVVCGGVALAAGAGLSALAYAMLTRPFSTISGFHLQNAVPGGGGTNVVNVILVDFRSYDTFGEIIVLAIAALGVTALLADARLPPSRAFDSLSTDQQPIMLTMLVRPLAPLALAIAAYLFLRGHYLPGGGFVAGLIVAITIMLHFMAGGLDGARRRVPGDFLWLCAAGLLLAAATGTASLFFNQPFLRSAFVYLDPPLLEKFSLASAMVFDLGVLLVVLGSSLALLAAMGDLRRRETASTRLKPPSQESSAWN